MHPILRRGLFRLAAGACLPALLPVDSNAQSHVGVNKVVLQVSDADPHPPDRLPAIGFVAAGVVEPMRKQQEGCAYIRP